MRQWCYPSAACPYTPTATSTTTHTTTAAAACSYSPTATTTDTTTASATSPCNPVLPLRRP